MKKEILIRRDVFYAVCAGYLTVPVILFLALYLKPYIGIPAALIIAGCALYSCLDFCKMPDKKLSGKSSDYAGMKMPLKYLIALGVIALITVFVSGKISITRVPSKRSALPKHTISASNCLAR